MTRVRCCVCRYRREKIDTNPRFVLWFSGLRGGVAFALSASAKQAMPVRCGTSMLPSAPAFVTGPFSLFSRTAGEWGR